MMKLSRKFKKQLKKEILSKISPEWKSKNVKIVTYSYRLKRILSFELK